MKGAICFVGEDWLGSCARSFREAIVRAGMAVEEIQETRFFPQWRHLALRGLLRIAAPAIRREFERAVLKAVRGSGARLLIVYKGTFVTRTLLEALSRQGCKTVNVYPDCNPLNQGATLREALGHYDLVVSTKVWHPEAWKPLFGYANRCRFVPQGYDPRLHYRPVGERTAEYDIGMVSTYRPEYGGLARILADDPDLRNRRVALFGNGWQALRSQFPTWWVLPGPAEGRAYMEALSLAKVYIAPLTREVIVQGKPYPGDEDSTRTYELPAAGCFYVHRRTDYVETLFEEDREVLYFDDAVDLAEQLKRGLGDAQLRMSCRVAAQHRAVPRDSLDSRVRSFFQILAEEGILDSWSPE